MMHVVILSAWILCLIRFDPKLIALVDPTDPPLATLSVIFFILCLNVFWFYGIYHISVVAFAAFARRTSRGNNTTIMRDGPSVAILYTAMNDFAERAAKSCLAQDYANYHLFILDDSTDGEIQKRIDNFAAGYPDRCTVIRRGDRAGFKAGNLNNALRHHAIEFPYFAVVDADEVIPSGFISRLLPRFCADERIGFIQASHTANPDQPTKFARDLAETVDIFWKRYLPARERFGFLIFYGHGAIIRRNVWVEVGGFPELVSEDLAFSCKIAERGWRGRYAEDVVCHEDIPAAYVQFKRRHNKWIRGAIEFLLKGYASFAASRRVSLREKIDVFASCVALCLPLLFIPFLLVANVVIPFYFMDTAKPYEIILPVIKKAIHLWPLSSLDPKFGVTWNWDFYLMTLLGMFAQMAGLAIHLLPGRPFKFLTHFTKSAAVHISIMMSAVTSVAKYLVTGKTEFASTGDREIETGGLNVTRHISVASIEFVISVLLSIIALITLNAGLLAIALAFATGPVILRIGWGHRLAKAMLFLPLFFLMVMMTVTGLSMIGSSGVLQAACNLADPMCICVDPGDKDCVCNDPNSEQCSCTASCEPPPGPIIIPPPIYF